MPRLPRLSGAETIHALERMGFIQVRQRGSHVVMKRTGSETSAGCVIPLHSQLAVVRYGGILKQGGITPEDFIANL